VPDSLSQPFVRARIQPLLQDGIRATYLSVQSLAGRLLFAATLAFVATRTTDQAAVPYAELQVILAVYTAFGIVALAGLVATFRSARV
jgi:hypothetical protein